LTGPLLHLKTILLFLCIATLSLATEPAASGPRASYYKDGEIHITMLGQPETKPITNGHWDFKPSWSITGDHLVIFRRLKDDPDVNNWITAMCIIKTDGTGFHPLSDGTFTDFNATWTRDGKYSLVWNRKVPGKHSYHIMASKIGGKPGEEIQLTEPSYHAWVHSAMRVGRLFVSATPPNLGGPGDGNAGGNARLPGGLLKLRAQFGRVLSAKHGDAVDRPRDVFLMARNLGLGGVKKRAGGPEPLPRLP
jgi:hypothetical protein